MAGRMFQDSGRTAYLGRYSFSWCVCSSELVFSPVCAMLRFDQVLGGIIEACIQSLTASTIVSLLTVHIASLHCITCGCNAAKAHTRTSHLHHLIATHPLAVP